ncbi:hypothetical protein JTE90_017351 [Oedothorax gibbosus]|uniref:Uncharacterized protein n=1 Tax=Oedothorax gibbosus TaxID=931172 RepID=A0AAV6VQQ6_9ARAC|nr:hypothetical protein JTE90_017351 [Oedothorax gibbosus]
MPPKVLSNKNVPKSDPDKQNEDQLNEEIDIFLTVYNPYISPNCVEFDQKFKHFKAISDHKKPVVYYRKVGSTKRRLEGSYGIVYEEVPITTEKSASNSFDFRSASTETSRVHQRDQNEYTEPTLFPVLKFQGTASKAEILSAYEEHEKKKDADKENEKQNDRWFKGDLKVLLKFTARQELGFNIKNNNYLRLCERILDQNMTEANLDYAFYDSPVDEVKPDSGSLLPLWRLQSGLVVRDVAFNPHYPDMLAVGYGEVNKLDEDDLGKTRERGTIHIYSLKCPTHPEQTIECSEGVSCLSFHPHIKHLLGVAFTRGGAAAVDLRHGAPPQSKDSKFRTWFHRERVTELEWSSDPVPLKFCTISHDGKVINWELLMDDLFPTGVVAELKLKDSPLEAPPRGLEMNTEPRDGEDLGLNIAGTSLSLHPSQSDLFLAGTGNGSLRNGSFARSRCGPSLSDGHAARIRRVCWNRLHPGVFISCGDDFTVQVWDKEQERSVLELFFDHGVEDVAWAPYSTTVFAAVTSRSVVSVFDLSLDKEEALAVFEVYTKKQDTTLTRIAFHPNRPLLAAGDERGCVTILKLSPNIRSSLKNMLTMEKSKFVSGEIAKMDKLLAAATDEVKN